MFLVIFKFNLTNIYLSGDCILFYSNELAFTMVENTDKSCSLKSPINLNSEDSADIETHVQGTYSALR